MRYSIGCFYVVGRQKAYKNTTKFKDKKGENNMNEKILQIIPAPANLLYGFDGGEAQPVICLALVECGDGSREVRAFGLTNGELIDEVPGAVLFVDR